MKKKKKPKWKTVIFNSASKKIAEFNDEKRRLEIKSKDHETYISYLGDDNFEIKHK